MNIFIDIVEKDEQEADETSGERESRFCIFNEVKRTNWNLLYRMYAESA